jgi:hypothetical protein
MIVHWIFSRLNAKMPATPIRRSGFMGFDWFSGALVLENGGVMEAKK